MQRTISLISSVIFLLFILNSCITIIKVPSKGKTDMSDSFSPNELTNFNYLEVNAGEFAQIINATDTAVVNFFAPWCPYSYNFIREGKYLKNISFKQYFICTNYDIASIENLFFEKLPTDTIYLISPVEYGDNESIKTKMFLADLFELSVDSVVGGVPQHYLFSSGKVIKKSSNVISN